MLEVESKYRVPAGFVLPDDLAAPGPAERHEDYYLDPPDRDFRTTGEAFRLRRVNDQNVLTYKGPRQPGPVKIRTEVEVPVGGGDPADLVRLFELLGYRLVAVVRKTRRPFAAEYDGRPVTICLDEVEGAGSFVEVEVLTDDAGAAAAQAVVRAVAAELDLTEVEPRSYLTLVRPTGTVHRGPPVGPRPRRR